MSMYQQQVPQPRDEHNWGKSGSEYEEGYAGNLQQSDQLADAIARRLQAQTPSNLQAPVPASQIQFNHHPMGVTAGMRLALAIVSVSVLIPLSAISFSILGALAGLVGLGVVCAVILGINFLFNLRS